MSHLDMAGRMDLHERGHQLSPDWWRRGTASRVMPCCRMAEAEARQKPCPKCDCLRCDVGCGRLAVHDVQAKNGEPIRMAFCNTHTDFEDRNHDCDPCPHTEPRKTVVDGRSD